MEGLVEKSKKNIFSSLQNLLELCSALLQFKSRLAEYKDLEVFLNFFLNLCLSLNALFTLNKNTGDHLNLVKKKIIRIL